MTNYIGIDVAKEVSVVCALNAAGGFRLRATPVPTQAMDIMTIVNSIPKPRALALEEGCQAAWLYSVLEPLCERIVVVNTKKNKALGGEKKSDNEEAYRLAERLRAGVLQGVWHGGERFQRLRELVGSYVALTKDLTRIKLRMHAVYRSRGICPSKDIFDLRKKGEGKFSKLPLAEQRMRLEVYFELLKQVHKARVRILKELVRLAGKEPMYKAFKSMPQVGEVYASLLVGIICLPERFRTRKQFWSYCGFAVSTYESGEYEVRNNKIVRKSRARRTRGLVKDFNRTLKYIFKQVAVKLSRGAWKEQYQKLIDKKISPANARLTLARKAAAIALHLAKTGEKYNAELAFAVDA